MSYSRPSRAVDFVSPVTACFVAVYGAECGRGAIAEMEPLQRRILDAGAEALRPGGVLVYSTCTISPTENERLIAAFLDSHPDFALDDLAAEMPVFALSSSSRDTSTAAARCLLTLPHRDHTAGFFIARLRRS